MNPEPKSSLQKTKAFLKKIIKTEIALVDPTEISKGTGETVNITGIVLSHDERVLTENGNCLHRTFDRKWLTEMNQGKDAQGRKTHAQRIKQPGGEQIIVISLIKEQKP